MDVNPQGSHIHFRDPQTPWINDPNSVSMEGQTHDLNLLKGRCVHIIKHLMSTKGSAQPDGQPSISGSSIGVLLSHKTNHTSCDLFSRSLFDPPLPPAKVEAIERIGFGRAGKVFIEFDAPFWSEGEEVIKIAWGKQGGQFDLFPVFLPESGIQIQVCVFSPFKCCVSQLSVDQMSRPLVNF